MRKAILVLPAIATLILSICFRQGMRASDDLVYAQVAMSLLPGEQSPPLFHQPIHHDARIGATFPLAAAFSLLGASDVSLALLPLFCTVLTASLVAWLACRFGGGAAGLSAGLLYAVFPQTAYLSTFYVPEPILNLELCLASALFLLAIERESGNVAYLEFLAGVLIGVAYLTTEVGALMLPVFFLYVLVARRVRLRDAWLLAGFMVVLCAELAYNAAVHGNPLYRFTLGESYASEPMVVAANVDLTYRLLKAVPSMFVYPSLDFGVFGPLLLIGGAYGLFRWRRSSLLVIWAATVLLFYTFMSASFSHYVALPVTARLLTPACVPLLVLSGMMLVDLWGWTAGNSAVVVRYVGRMLFPAGALGLGLVSLLVMYLNNTPSFSAVLARNAKLAAGFLQEQSSVTVVSDRVSARAIQFYRHFNPRDSFLRFEAASRFLGNRLGNDSTKPVFVVLNGPVIHEKEITGQFYGSGLSLSPRDRDLLPQFLPGSGAEVFSAQVRSGPLLEMLLRYPAVRYLLGPYAYRLAQELFAQNPPLAEVRVFRYSGRQGEREQFPAWERGVR